MTSADHERDDELVSAYVDGEASPDEVRRVEDDPTLLARAEELRRVSQRVGEPVAPPSADIQAEQIAAALGASSTATNVASLDVARQRRRPSGRVLAIASAAAVIVALLIAIPILADFGDGGTETANDTAAEATDDSATTATEALEEEAPAENEAADVEAAEEEATEEATEAAASEEATEESSADEAATSGDAEAESAPALPESIGEFDTLAELGAFLALPRDDLDREEEFGELEGPALCELEAAEAFPELGEPVSRDTATVAGEEVLVFVYVRPPSELAVLFTIDSCTPTDEVPLPLE